MTRNIAIRDHIMSYRDISISIRDISDIIADYAESSPSDRLLIFLDRISDPSGRGFLINKEWTARFIKFDKDGYTLINIAYSTKSSNVWYHLDSGYYWTAETTMEKLSRNRVSVFKDIYNIINSTA